MVNFPNGQIHNLKIFLQNLGIWDMPLTYSLFYYIELKVYFSKKFLPTFRFGKQLRAINFYFIRLKICIMLGPA